MKIGDWVVVLPEDPNFYNCEQNEAQQVLEFTDGWGEEEVWIGLSFRDGSTNNYELVRLATEEEIRIRLYGENIVNTNNKNEKEISMKRITEILEKVYNSSELRKTIVPLFIGNPGLGKTVLIEDFARNKKVNLVELITSQMSPFEVSGICIPDKDTKQMKYYNFDKLENLKDGDILFFDELLNGNPVVLNACLTLLEQRRFISGKKLPDIMIIAAANPQGMTPLTPQIKERFVWYQTKFDSGMWQDFMFNKYKMPKIISTKLCALIKEEDFTANNFNTPRSIDKAVNMILHDVPTPYNVILPILDTLIENKAKQKVKLKDGEYLEINEKMTWLELVKIKIANGNIKK